MPTIKDIALEAGVSHGTVSNVLNKSGKVSIEKIRLVEAAAKKLGYRLNVQAKQLRHGSGNQIGMILPSIENHYLDFYLSCRKLLEQFGYDVLLYITYDIEALEREAISKVLSNRPKAVIGVTCLENVYDYYDLDTKLILIDRHVDDQEGKITFASFDYSQAGKEIASFIAQKSCKRIALFSAPIRFSNERLLYESILSTLHETAEIHLFNSDDNLMLSKAFDLLHSQTNYDAIITTDVKRANCIYNALSYIKSKERPLIVSITNSKNLPDQNIVYYELDYKRLGHKIADIIIESNNHNDALPTHYLCPNDGFRFDYSVGLKTHKDTAINILTLESPASLAINKLLENFRSKSGIQVTMTMLPFDELYNTINSFGSLGCYDLIRMDMAWFSHLAEEVYIPLESIHKPIHEIHDKLIDELGYTYSLVNHIAYAFPLDPSIQLLYYRKDIFEDAKIKRQFYEQYREELEVPQNFKQYNKVASFFTKAVNPLSPVEYGSTLTYGTASVAACDYLPRLFDYSGHIFDANGKILINTKEALEALYNYLETYRYTNQKTAMWWKQSVENFASGNTAMTIVFNNHAFDMINSKHSNVVGKVGVASIPGNKPLLGGGVIGISKNSTKIDESFEFLKWLYSDETASIITMLGGLSPNKSTYSNYEIQSIIPWLDIAKKSFSYGNRREKSNYYATFNENKFENILGAAVRSAISKTTTPEEALIHIQAIYNTNFN